mmetsp:Transcript_124776/g.388424  ORF Transcript_124776/g.388424 Transcript_124776/m.388424 type:complete len:741 (+) Transcript_124776:1417-3639(+)
MLRLRHWWYVTRHALGANSRDPLYRWKLLFGLLFLIVVILIAVLQTKAITALTESLKGNTEDAKRSSFSHKAPGFIAIFLVSIAVLGISAYVLLKWLPEWLVKQRDGKLYEESERLTEDTTKAIWTDAPAAKEDSQLRMDVLNMLVERHRAFPDKDAPEVASKSDYAGVPIAKDDKRSSVLRDPMGCQIPLATVPVFADDGASVMESTLRLHNKQAPLKRLLCTDWAWSSPRYLVERTPLQVRLEFLKKTDESRKMPGDEPIPNVGLALKSEKLETLVCTIQVVNFVGLTLGKTDRNDGVLSLWRSPDLKEADQLVRWFHEVRRFFADYGASFDRGSRVYAVLECLFWGVRNWGKEEAPVPGEHVEDHKRSYMQSHNGLPYAPWVYRNMDDLVSRFGPNPGKQDETEDVSDDEQRHLADEEKKDRQRKGLPPDVPPSKPKSKSGPKGTLVLVIRGAKGLPDKDSKTVMCKCVVKTATEQTTETPAGNAINPQWGHQQLFTDYEPGKNEISFTVMCDGREMATATETLALRDIQGGEWKDREVSLEINSSFKPKEPEGCAAACGCASTKATDVAESRPKLQFRIVWNAEEEEDDGSLAPRVVEGRLKKGYAFQRPRAAAGFCGGPVTWQLLYPPAGPELLHVAVTAQDLQVCSELPQPAFFAAAPVLGRRGWEPPVRETRVLGREPGRRQDPEDPKRPEAGAKKEGATKEKAPPGDSAAKPPAAAAARPASPRAGALSAKN